MSIRRRGIQENFFCHLGINTVEYGHWQPFLLKIYQYAGFCIILRRRAQRPRRPTEAFPQAVHIPGQDDRAG